MKVVVDTNVLVVAQGSDAPQASTECIKKCAITLREIVEQHILILDDARCILKEYGAQFVPGRSTGVGYEFYIWVLQNLSNLRHCELIQITPLVFSEDGNDFAEFPQDPDLANFDRSDRKFVAVALAHPERPPILNAVDTDWWHHRHVLERCGVNLGFLCPDAMGT